MRTRMREDGDVNMLGLGIVLGALLLLAIVTSL
jgi:hypothetical protein